MKRFEGIKIKGQFVPIPAFGFLTNGSGWKLRIGFMWLGVVFSVGIIRRTEKNDRKNI